MCSRVQVNKAKGIMVPFEDFREEFQSRVTSIGHILAMMAPWDCPVYVTRVRAEPLYASLCLSVPISVSLCWQLTTRYPYSAGSPADPTHTGN